MSLRLVKVVVQPHYVWDDGENLQEVQTEPVVVSPKDWPGYPEKLSEQIKEQEDELKARLDDAVS